MPPKRGTGSVARPLAPRASGAQSRLSNRPKAKATAGKLGRPSSSNVKAAPPVKATGAGASVQRAGASAAKPAPATNTPKVSTGEVKHPPLAPGMRMCCTGLQACPELNGVFCKLKEYIPDKGRWLAEVEKDGSMRNFRPENLLHVAPPVAANARAPEAAPTVAGKGRPPATPAKGQAAGDQPAAAPAIARSTNAQAGLSTNAQAVPAVAAKGRPPAKTQPVVAVAAKSPIVASSSVAASSSIAQAKPLAAKGSEAPPSAAKGRPGRPPAKTQPMVTETASAPVVVSPSSNQPKQLAAKVSGQSVGRFRQVPKAAMAKVLGKRKQLATASPQEIPQVTAVPPEVPLPCHACGHIFAGNFCNNCGARRAPVEVKAAPQAKPAEVTAAPQAKMARVTGKGRGRRKGGGKGTIVMTSEVPPAKRQKSEGGDNHAVVGAEVSEASASVLPSAVKSPTVASKRLDAKANTQAAVKTEANAKAPGPAAKLPSGIASRKSEARASTHDGNDGSPPRVIRRQSSTGSHSGPLAPIGALPSPPPRTSNKRLRGKTSASDASNNVAMALKRLAALGEAQKASNTELDSDKAEEAAKKYLAAAIAAAEKHSAHELKALTAKEVQKEELEGERGSGSQRIDVGPKKPRPDGDDEDQLFDLDDDLEEEEEVSDMSDIAEEDGDEVVDEEDWAPVGALNYPEVWSPTTCRPGDKGFNDYAAQCLPKAGLGTESSLFAGLGLRLHQESAAFMVHPKSPIARLLVDHATGTGKTLIMIRIMDNFFDDPRPKVAVFPKDAVCDNFYQELMKWPSRWREFFAFCCPDQAALACGASNWKRKRFEVWDLQNDRVRHEAKRRNVRQEKVLRELIDAIRTALEMKNAIRRGQVKPEWAKKFIKDHPGAGVPHAPLRAFRYTTAGGRASELAEDGWPRSPILKVGFDPKELNPFSGKVVVMDEAHNLVRPTAKFEEQLGRLRTYLYAAHRTVLAGFTGTPVGNEPEEGRTLLDVMKGEGAIECSDEGFVSSFHARGSEDFPKETPVKGIPDGIIHEGMFEHLIKRHSLHGEALKRYLLKETEFLIVPRLLRLPEEKRQARLSNYCNLHTHYGRCYGVHKEALLKDVKQHAPKMHAIVKSIIKHKQKTVVMLAREQGYKAMLEVLQRAGRKNNFRVATLEDLHDFNDPRKNLRGERFRVMCAETSQAGEGIQFKHVRRICLVDVPLRHSDLVQRTSRSVRMGGHAALPVEERTLAVEMHMAQLPKFLKTGPGSLIYRELCNAKEVHNTPGISLEAAAHACLEELQRREVKTLQDLQKLVQADDGEKFIDLITEIALEAIGDSSHLPARPLAMALWRLRRGGDDLAALEKQLVKSRTSDDTLLEWLMDKSFELLTPLEAMRFGAVDRSILAKLGDPPRAPPPRSEAAQLRAQKALATLEADVVEGAVSTVEAAAPVEGEGQRVYTRVTPRAAVETGEGEEQEHGDADDDDAGMGLDEAALLAEYGDDVEEDGGDGEEDDLDMGEEAEDGDEGDLDDEKGDDPEDDEDMLDLD